MRAWQPVIDQFPLHHQPVHILNAAYSADSHANKASTRRQSADRLQTSETDLALLVAPNFRLTAASDAERAA
jgi:hypothetical protein